MELNMGASSRNVSIRSVDSINEHVVIMLSIMAQCCSRGG